MYDTDTQSSPTSPTPSDAHVVGFPTSTGSPATLHCSTRWLIGGAAHAAATEIVEHIGGRLQSVAHCIEEGVIGNITAVGHGVLIRDGNEIPAVFVLWAGRERCIINSVDPFDETFGGVPGILRSDHEGVAWIPPSVDDLEQLGDPLEVLDAADALLDAYVTARHVFPEAEPGLVADATIGMFAQGEPEVGDVERCRHWTSLCRRIELGAVRLPRPAHRKIISTTPVTTWRQPANWSFRPGEQAGRLCAEGVPPRARVVNLGAGTQSTAMVIAMCEGLIPGTRIVDGVNVDDGTPLHVVFADTGAEHPGTYRHLQRLAEHLGERFGQGIDVVSAGNLAVDQVAHAFAGERGSNPPWWVLGQPDGDLIVAYDRKVGMLGRRTCTETFKKAVLVRHLRLLLGAGPSERVPSDVWLEQAYGMSRDEAARRMRNPGREDRWAAYTYPLTDPLGWSRDDSVSFLRKQGFTEVPRSACVFCPLVHNRSGQAFTRQVIADTEAWLLATAVDSAVRTRMRGVQGRCYVHQDAVPLGVADLRTRAERIGATGQLALFTNPDLDAGHGGEIGDETDDLAAVACSSACFT